MRFSARHIRIAAAVLALAAGALGALRVDQSDPGAAGKIRDVAAPATDTTVADSSALTSVRPDTILDQPRVTLAVAGDLELHFLPVIVTGYASSEANTDSTPNLTATMTQTRPGCIALSRDLLRTFTPGAPFDFGDCVVIPDVGVFSVEDTMHPRWLGRADIWFADAQHALRWGRRPAMIARLPEVVEVNASLLAVGPQIRDLAPVLEQ